MPEPLQHRVLDIRASLRVRWREFGGTIGSPESAASIHALDTAGADALHRSPLLHCRRLLRNRDSHRHTDVPRRQNSRRCPTPSSPTPQSKSFSAACACPGMNSIMERWIQKCRHELLDHTLIWNQTHLLRALREYERHYNDTGHIGESPMRDLCTHCRNRSLQPPSPTVPSANGTASAEQSTSINTQPELQGRYFRHPQRCPGRPVGIPGREVVRQVGRSSTGSGRSRRGR